MEHRVGLLVIIVEDIYMNPNNEILNRFYPDNQVKTTKTELEQKRLIASWLNKPMNGINFAKLPDQYKHKRNELPPIHPFYGIWGKYGSDDGKWIVSTDDNERLGMNPKYLTNNDLWDTDWLKEKYPDRFKYRTMDEEEKWYANVGVFGDDAIAEDRAKADDDDDDFIQIYSPYFPEEWKINRWRCYSITRRNCKKILRHRELRLHRNS